MTREGARVVLKSPDGAAQDTLEDPANHVERDGFLDEIERIAEASGVFESSQFEQLAVFLGAPGVA